ncbi:MAG TPA: bifunctional diguanylate cyclase/phosphodiesterase [Pilimelia sp.]|nr:bifunctional diguanylate cyclase/phosphodiesterase [Pilimelia sp.]
MERFVCRWAHGLTGISFVPLEPVELTSLLRDLVGRVLAALAADDPAHGPDPPAAEVGRSVGAALAAAHLTNPLAVARTIELFGRWLLVDLAGDLASGPDPRTLAARLVGLQAGLADGYAAALRAHTLAEQEEVSTAALAALRAAEYRRRAVEARFRAVFANAAVGIGVVDTAGVVVDVNPALARMLGRRAEWLCGRRVTEVVDRNEAPWIRDHLRRLLCGERDEFRLETPHRRPDGRLVRLDLSMTLVRDEQGAARYAVAVVADVTDQRRLEARLWHEARHDALTGLANRTLFLERLARACAAAARGARLGVCLLDLDGFKAVNDSLGHSCGDRLLVAVAERLRRSVGQAGTVARLGGDEFAVLVRNPAGPDQVAALAQAMLTALSAPIRLDGHDLRVSASVGVVERAACGADPAEVMRAADIALYRAKAAGRRRWALHDPRGCADDIARHTLTTALPAALDRGEFVLEYQPLVSLDDGALRAVEALVRWEHPRLGRIPPGRFITLAEDSGLITALGRWVLTEACRQAGRWRARHGCAPPVSVNLASAQAHDARLVEDVVAVLAETGLEPGRLQLELTESAVLGHEQGPVDALRALAETGVRLAIDDFGTGYSNLAYLARLPVHELKIAGALVDGLDCPSSGAASHTIVASVVGLAHALGLGVTAEGVETPAQADLLRMLGCDTGQGWLFGRPGPAESIDALLRRGGPLAAARSGRATTVPAVAAADLA